MLGVCECTRRWVDGVKLRGHGLTERLTIDFRHVRDEWARDGGALAADDVERWINSDSHSSEEDDDSMMVPLLPPGGVMQYTSQLPQAAFVVK